MNYHHLATALLILAGIVGFMHVGGQCAVAGFQREMGEWSDWDRTQDRIRRSLIFALVTMAPGLWMLGHA